MSPPQSKKQYPEVPKEVDQSPQIPYSLQELQEVRHLFREPGWRVFLHYRVAMRAQVERSLHNDDLSEPLKFPLRQAAALGQHKLQLRYDKFEQEIEMYLEQMLQQKEGMSNENV